MAIEHVDVLVVGAGLSGIGAAYRLQNQCPGVSYAVVEGRDRLGGTWDLFRYPGIRSDSDMYTLGYPFKPWTGTKGIADGASILRYLQETAAENGIDRHIRYEHRVKRAAWSSREARWTVEMERGAGHEPVRLTCGFLFLCSGYYRYEHGHDPEFAGRSRFRGRIVHPQAWPEDLDYAGKRVVVIGSGATAVTLVPAMAETAAHVTMLQRSPTYVVARPTEDPVAKRLRRRMSPSLASRLTRWKNIGLGMYFYRLSRKQPERMRRMILGGVRQALGPDYDVERHFTPRYNPWDQRLCLVADGDLFSAIRDGRAEVVTDEVETFTETGIRLRGGRELAADIIVTATGLELQSLGGIAVEVDGRPFVPAEAMTYKGMMFADVPNLAATFGYTNASWTLKSDLISLYVCRLLNHMRTKGYASCTPRQRDPSITRMPWVDFTSGYVVRARHLLPSQGSRRPWRLYQNYVLDTLSLRLGSVEDGIMEFARPGPQSQVSDAKEPRAA